jgi:RNA polymerase sigma-70 factor (ECF subfamily)
MYSKDVFRFAFYLTGDQSDAEDLTSETFVRVWMSERAIRMETVRGFLFSIARNLFLQSKRANWRHVALESSLRSSAPDPEEATVYRTELDAVMDKLREIPGIDRAALLMRAEYGLSYEEIARALNISVGAAKVKVYRARKTLAPLRAD